MRIYEKLFSAAGISSGVDLIIADFHKIVDKLQAYEDLHLAHRDNKALQIEDLKQQLAVHEAERLKAESVKEKIKSLLS